MKRILITICTLFACVMLSVAQGDSYKITGQVGNSVNGKLLLVALTEKGGHEWSFRVHGPDVGNNVGLLDAGSEKCGIGNHYVGERELHDYRGSE